MDPTCSRNGRLDALPDLDACHASSGHVQGTQRNPRCGWSTAGRNDLGQALVVDPNPKPPKEKIRQVAVNSMVNSNQNNFEGFFLVTKFSRS